MKQIIFAVAFPFAFPFPLFAVVNIVVLTFKWKNTWTDAFYDKGSVNAFRNYVATICI